MLIWIFPALLLAAPLEPFGAPLPEGVVLVTKTTELDSYGQKVTVAVYEASSAYDALAQFYRRSMKRRRMVRVAEQRESIIPGYVPDPADPRTFIPVLRVVNLDYTQRWAGVYVRPTPKGALLAVLERREPPEVPGADNLPARIEIPRAIFDLERPLVRR